MRSVPYINLSAQHVPLKSELLKAVGKVLDHGNFILGEEVRKFETELARYCGTKYAVGVNSGTDALFLSLKALGIGQGDEVITVPNSFLSTASVIIAVGARPVFVDVGQDMNIDPPLVEAGITSKTRAIIPVHLTGNPARMDAITKIARKKKLYVIEDAAQAIGAEYKGKKVGSLGDAGCFSLHPLKTLNACGDGGVITTNNEKLYSSLLQLRNIGLKNRDESDIWGYNSRLDAFQAAILLVKLKYLDQWIKRRRGNAIYYENELKDLVKVPLEVAGLKAVYHTFIIRTSKRDALRSCLQENGVGTKVHYSIPIHLQKAAASLGYKKGDFPVCEEQAEKILSLPISQELRVSDLAFVVAKIRDFMRSS